MRVVTRRQKGMFQSMNLALFDFDGTITQKETFADFMRFAVSRRRRLLGAIVFLSMWIGYKLGVVSGNRIRASLVRFGFRGVPAEHVQAKGGSFPKMCCRPC
jgi:phosphatidylglycerophosphatase C